MRYGRATALATALLMIAIVPAGAEGGEVPESHGRASDEPFEIIGGIPWSPDMRITRNPADDTLPQVTGDRDHNAHIVWRRSGMWTQTFDRTGSPLSKEVFITPHVVNGYGDPDKYPIGPTVAIDSRGSIHVTWDDGWTNVYYQKFDAWGNVLTDVIHVGNDDNTASHMPSIAVDPVNDYVHIVHEDYQYQCEDIVYEKLDNNGKALVNGVAVSSDVSSHCEGSTLTTDTKGFIHVAFGTSSGAMWRKVDQNGVARGVTQKVFPAPVYAIPDLAVTPNGEVHMVRTWEGRVLYTRIDHNGTIIDEAVPISTSGAGVGRARIAAARDSNTVYVVWTDHRDGNGEVYFAEMRGDLQGTIPENHRLTTNRARSWFPDVTVDPEDQVHVVWEDYRDGNAEIYYKTMYGIRFQISPVDVAELGYMRYFHPNQTKRFHFYIENQGVLPDGYDVTLTLDDWADEAGWSAQLDEDEFREVEGDTKVYFNLTLTSPARARAGDSINVTLRATSVTSPAINETLSWREFIIVEKAVTMTCTEPVKLVEPGASVRFDLLVTNIGDVPDVYVVEYSLIPGEKGWEVAMDTGDIILDVGENRSLEVVLKAPEDARTDLNGTVFIRVFSKTDPSAWDGKKLMGFVNPTFRLLMDTSRTDRYVEPGGNVIFPITVENVGTVHDNVTVHLGSTDVLTGWSAALTPETIHIGGGETRQLFLNVMAPEDALAGLRQSITVTAFSDEYSSAGRLEVSVIVNQVHRLEPSISLVGHSMYAGETSSKNHLSVLNLGNGLETVTLGTKDLPAGWQVTFEHEGLESTEVVIPPKLSKDAWIVVTAPFDTEAGRYGLRLVVTDSSGQDYHIVEPVTLLHTHGLDLSAEDHYAEGVPGSQLTFRLVLENRGNGVDTFAFELLGLPDGSWTGRFLDRRGRETELVMLSAWETTVIELKVHAPKDLRPATTFEMTVRATSTSNEVDEVKLTMAVMMPDLRIRSVTYDPSESRYGQVTRIDVQVVNDGDHGAEDVVVVLTQEGKVLSQEAISNIHPHQMVAVSFAWMPPAGTAHLTYHVSSATPEADLSDNELTHRRSVTVPAEDPHTFVWVAIALAGLSLLVLLYLYARADGVVLGRRKRDGHD